MSRIEDVLYADYETQNPSQAASKRSPLGDTSTPVQCTTPSDMFPSPKEETYCAETPNSMTLSDFMGWGLDQGEGEAAKKELAPLSDEASKEGFDVLKHPHMQKIANIVTNKKVSYLENLGGLRSPTARH